MKGCMSNEEMKESLIEFIIDDTEFSEISQDEIIEIVDKRLEYEEYENMTQGDWEEYYLHENLSEIEKSLNEKKKEKQRLIQQKKKIVATVATLNPTVISDILELILIETNRIE